MGYSLHWQVEKQVICFKLYDVVSADDLISGNRRIIEMLHEGTQPIHIVFDTLAVISYPNNLRWIIHMIKGNPRHAEGWRIVVADDNEIRVLLSAILSSLNVPVHACSTLQEAHEFINELTVEIPAVKLAEPAPKAPAPTTPTARSTR